MSSPANSLSPQWVRFFYNVGRLWPEITALGLYLAHLWLPFFRTWGGAHPAARGVAFILIVYLAHQQIPLGRGK